MPPTKKQIKNAILNQSLDFKIEIVKKRKPYPKRIYKEDADKLAIILLRDCGNMSFKMIASLLGYKESSKRNLLYTYEHYKNKYQCKQCSRLLEDIKKISNIKDNQNAI